MLKMATEVSRWLSAAAMDLPAFKIRFCAETSTLPSTSPSTILPFVEVMRTVPFELISPPRVTSVAPARLMEPLLLSLLVLLSRIEPLAASRSIEPAPVLTSAPLLKMMLSPPSSDIWPLADTISALAVRLPLPPAERRILPLPLAETATESGAVVPSFRVMLPLVVRRTIEPLLTVVRRSDWVPSLDSLRPADSLTLWIVTRTSPTMMSFASRILMPPLTARAAMVVTSVSIAFTFTPN